MKKGKTKLEKEKEKKRELQESIDYLKQVDLPEAQGGGKKFVRDTIVEEERLKKDTQDMVATYLQGKQTQSHTYRRALANYGYSKLSEEGLPDDYQFWFIPTDGSEINIFGKMFKTQEGVVLVLKSPNGSVYVRAIKTTMLAEYDLNAVNIMCLQAENTVDSERGLLESDKADTASVMEPKIFTGKGD